MQEIVRVKANFGNFWKCGFLFISEQKATRTPSLAIATGSFCRFLLFPVALLLFAWRLPVALLSLSCRFFVSLSCRCFLLPPCRRPLACLLSSCRLPVASLSPPCRLTW